MSGWLESEIKVLLRLVIAERPEKSSVRKLDIEDSRGCVVVVRVCGRVCLSVCVCVCVCVCVLQQPARSPTTPDDLR